MKIQNALYMIPVNISDGPISDVMPQANIEAIGFIKDFIVEDVRTARRFLKKANPSIEISELYFHELNRHTPENEISLFLDALRKGRPMGVMSEAGCPGVADPGAKVVSLAQKEGYKVIPLVGPSSILLALMASGFNGQKFMFHGYLPVKDNERDKAIKELEAQSRRNDITQIFIETPYRNAKMMESLMKNLSHDTFLCVASDITSEEGETIITRTIHAWKSGNHEIKKVPTIFLIYAGN